MVDADSQKRQHLLLLTFHCDSTTFCTHARIRFISFQLRMMNAQTDIYFGDSKPIYSSMAFRISIGFSAQCTKHFTIDVRKGEMEEILPTDPFRSNDIQNNEQKCIGFVEIPKQNPTINKMELGSEMVALRQFFFFSLSVFCKRKKVI